MICSSLTEPSLSKVAVPFSADTAISLSPPSAESSSVTAASQCPQHMPSALSTCVSMTAHPFLFFLLRFPQRERTWRHPFEHHQPTLGGSHDASDGRLYPEG